MSAEPTRCPKCNGAMVQGFIFEFDGAQRKVSSWVEGASTAGNLSSRPMGDSPWLGDACSLVDAFRSGERSPVEELEAVLAAIDASALHAMPFVDADGARAAAASADVTRPFGGVPVAVGTGVALIEPLKRNIWSGSAKAMPQESERMPQSVQRLPNPPPGLRQLARLKAV